MNVSDTFILQLNISATIVLLTVGFVLLFKKNNVRANIFLGFLMLYPVISIIINIIFIIFHQHQLLFLAPMNIGVNLTFGPVLLSYLYFIQGNPERKTGFSVLHYIPALIVFISAAYYLFIPEEEQSFLLERLLKGEEGYINLINHFLLIHICIYLYIAWKKVKIYEEISFDMSIPETENSVKWQKALLGCIILVNILLLLSFILPILIIGKAHIYSDLIATPIAALVMYVFLIYKGLSYHVIYNQTEYKAFATAAEPLNHFIEELKKQSQISKRQTLYEEEFLTEIHNKLENLFNEQEIYTKPGLKLHDVAVMLEISPATLSFTINKHMKTTFFELINTYRVKKAKHLLMGTDHRHYKIEYIGELSGFNSRASFFSVFKKQVGKTPQSYRDNYLEKRA